jgi:hypothetical protein
MALYEDQKKSLPKVSYEKMALGARNNLARGFFRANAPQIISAILGVPFPDPPSWHIQGGESL